MHSVVAGKGRFMGLFPPQAYLVVGQQAALIDAGENEEAYTDAILALLKEVAAPPLGFILVTHHHPDHWGGAEKLRKLTGARVVANRLTPEESAADIRVDDGYLVELGDLTLEAIHTPGHTAASLCFLLRERGILFSGDHILGMGTTVIRPEEGDMGQYIASLEKLLAYDVRMICPGHGPVIRSPQSKLQELIRHRREREAQVLDLLGQGVNTVDEMLKSIYPEVDSRLKNMARQQVRAHLAKLEKEGRARREPERFFLTG